jgi:hypothetical protein
VRCPLQGRLLEQPARSRDAAEADSLVVRTTMVQTRRSWRSAREHRADALANIDLVRCTLSGEPGCVVEK